ncbi:MAG: hypothetical protein U5M23_01955 [Marinagarivorans sp.]|nr:hypothetical protein [Marinagarivorans sp.]
MSLKPINLLLFFSFFLSLAACAEGRLSVYEVSAKDLNENGKAYLNDSVFMKGFLFIDQGAFLYPSLESVLKYDLDAAVFLQIDD